MGFFSVATLSRNLIENYHMFFYVGVDTISDQERDFRLRVLDYHLNSEKYKLYLELNVEKHKLEEFEINLPIDKELLRNHPFFMNLHVSKQGNILKGKQSMYLTHKEISDRLNFEASEFAPLYRFYSNHIHCSPLAYYSTSNDRGRGNENEAEVKYLSMSLDFCIKYLSAAIIDMTILFPEHVNALDGPKLQFIKKHFNTHNTV